jgi:hypothetical protein
VLSPRFPDSVVDTTVTFGIIRNSATFSRTLNITPVVNNFPDSIKIVSRVIVPAGTRMRSINDPNIAGKSVGTMTVKTFVDYRLNAYFDWAVVNAATMDLGADTFTIEEKGVRVFRRMEDRLFDFRVKATNRSNVNIRLYALFAPDSLRNRLYVDSLSLNQANRLVSDTSGLAERFGLVNLLGPQGVLIPPRDSMKENSIKLNEDQIDRILNTRKGSMRWMLRFMKSSRDSMMNVDNITLNSWIHLEGVSNMDSALTAY